MNQKNQISKLTHHLIDKYRKLNNINLFYKYITFLKNKSDEIYGTHSIEKKGNVLIDIFLNKYLCISIIYTKDIGKFYVRFTLLENGKLKKVNHVFHNTPKSYENDMINDMITNLIKE